VLLVDKVSWLYPFIIWPLACSSEIGKLIQKSRHAAYRLHGLRKNATIELLEAGRASNQVKPITEHLTTQMIDFYGRDIPKRRQGKAAIVKLEEARQNNGEPTKTRI
jgi:hypothetical protein